MVELYNKFKKMWFGGRDIMVRAQVSKKKSNNWINYSYCNNYNCYTWNR